MIFWAWLLRKRQSIYEHLSVEKISIKWNVKKFQINFWAFVVLGNVKSISEFSTVENVKKKFWAFESREKVESIFWASACRKNVKSVFLAWLKNVITIFWDFIKPENVKFISLHSTAEKISNKFSIFHSKIGKCQMNV